MQRRPVKVPPAVNYPANAAFLDRRRFLAVLGGAAGLVALEGCFVAGGMTPDNGEYYVSYLPAEPATHALVFPQQGTLNYVIQASALSYPLYSYLLSNEATLLQKADTALLTHAFSEFSAGASLVAVQQELMGVLADAYYGAPNSPTTDFASLVLTATQESGNQVR